jgi:hypothetical protein
MLLGLVLRFRFALPQIEKLDLAPLRTFAEPPTAIPIEGRSGPIVISIEYIIRQSDVYEFLSAMADRRRVRLRDGARNWTLLRDLHDAELWVERYDTPTWVDYLRHTQRTTQADAIVSARVKALHQGDTPRIHRMIERQTGSLPNGRSSGEQQIVDPLADPTRPN